MFISSIIELRSEAESLEYAEQAFNIKKPVFGVKGPTILSKICYKYLTSTAVDVMHLLFEGLMKKLIELWFDSKYENESFSIYHFIEVVDYRLCNIKPPSFVQRRFRPIKTHLKVWKGSKFRTFLKFIYLP